MATRKILHLDLDAFFCAVEEQRDPSLAGKPFAVGGRPDERGVVASCSYPARRCGVRSAMPMARALQLCPKLIIVSARHRAYDEVSGKVMAQLGQWTPLVEQISIDEAFLDLSDLPDAPEMLARRIQAEIHDRLGLPCSIGVASNKLVAKIATDAGKSRHRGEGPPNAITVVPSGEEAAFLAPLPVEALWGVGPKTAVKLADLGIHTIGDLARWDAHDLATLFGKNGWEMGQRAQGIDDRPVVIVHGIKSISQEVTFARDVNDGEELRRTLRELSDQVGRRLRQSGLAGGTVKVKLRWSDFTTITRQITRERPTDQDDEIFAAAWQLFEQNWRPRQPVRLIGVGISGLEDPYRQLSLWDTTSERGRRLQQALDELHDRFGDQALRRGRK